VSCQGSSKEQHIHQPERRPRGGETWLIFAGEELTKGKERCVEKLRGGGEHDLLKHCRNLM
jgi:hypothetical protein